MDETTTTTKPAKPKRPAPEGERAVRVPVELLERVAKLLPKLQATPWGDALRWNETALVRLALSRGVAVLEDELADEDELLRSGAPLGAQRVVPGDPSTYPAEGEPMPPHDTEGA